MKCCHLANVRSSRWSQLIDATLYLKRQRWSVWRCGKDIVEVSLRQRRQSCGIAGSGGSRSKRLGGRLASRHLPFIAKSHRTGGIRPAPRRRSRLALTATEREEISIGHIKEGRLRALEHFPKRLNRGIPLRERIGFKVRAGMEASMDGETVF